VREGLQRIGPDIARQAVRQLRLNLWLLLAVFGYAAAALAAVALLDVPDSFSLALYTDIVALATGVVLLVFLIAHPVYVMLWVRPQHLTRHILADWRERYFTADRLLTALPILVFLPVFISVFTSFKTMIPVLHAYDWDPTFAAWDRALHGGVAPWELLQPLLGRPWLTSAVNAAYQTWFFVLYGVIFWQAFSLRQARLRMQFFLTFVLSWSLLGTVAATGLASVGPCYYGLVVDGPDTYAPLMDYLRRANESFPVWSLGVQDMLWDRYAAGGFGIGGGISAMPSMHVSAAFLFVLIGRRANRVAALGFAAFALLILVGSVHLGWHYAIDGYASIPATWAIWRAVGWALARDPAFDSADADADRVLLPEALPRPA
jgi:hypothetical protein